MDGIAARTDDDLFEMANLFPKTTGLPMTVWVSPAQHDGRVKVSQAHGNRMDVSDTAVVGVRPAPRVIAGDLALVDEQAVSAWVSLNAGALVSYWDGEIDTADLLQQRTRV